MISVALVLQSNEVVTLEADKVIEKKNSTIQLKNMATSESNIITGKTEEETNETAEIIPIDMEVAPASVIIPPRIEVYEGMTIDELAEKLNRNLGTGYIAGKGYLIASQCIEKGVDPYVALAIMLHETGCKWNCSNLVASCNNVGGMKGSGCGSYASFNTLEEGIEAMISNLSRNYISQGLTTPETIGTKYAASSTWATKINYYMDTIRNA